MHFFLYYLIPICIAIVLFALLEGFTSLFLHNPSTLFALALALFIAALLISWLSSRSVSKRLKAITGDLKKVHEGKHEEISLRPFAQRDDLSRVIQGISKQIRESEQKLEILLEITRTVSSLLHLQDVLDAIVDLLTREFWLDACSIRLLDRDGNLRIRSQRGLSEKFVETATRKPTVDSYSGECFLTGKMVIINDAEKIDKPISTTLLVGEDIQSFAVTPVEAEGKNIGVLVTSSRKKSYFHERFSDVIYIVANQIGTAIRISQLYDKVYMLIGLTEANLNNDKNKIEDTGK